MLRRGATIESGTMRRIKSAAYGVMTVQSSLRDEIGLPVDQPWVETHGYLRRSLCDQGKNESAAGKVCATTRNTPTNCGVLPVRSALLHAHDVTKIGPVQPALHL